MKVGVRKCGEINQTKLLFPPNHATECWEKAYNSYAGEGWIDLLCLSHGSERGSQRIASARVAASIMRTSVQVVSGWLNVNDEGHYREQNEFQKYVNPRRRLNHTSRHSEGGTITKGECFVLRLTHLESSQPHTCLSTGRPSRSLLHPLLLLIAR